MHSRFIPGFIIASAAWTLVAGCSDKASESTATVADQPAQSMPAGPTIGDLKLAGTGTDASTSANLFAAGEPVQLSMNVTGVSPGEKVTAYWFGPSNQELAYELKPVGGNGEVNFTLDNTLDWKGGSYRAEIWVSGAKIEEKRFDIAEHVAEG